MNFYIFQNRYQWLLHIKIAHFILRDGVITDVRKLSELATIQTCLLVWPIVAHLTPMPEMLPKTLIPGWNFTNTAVNLIKQKYNNMRNTFIHFL